MPHFLVKELGGYASVALSVGIENIGIPFPGETALIGASIYAGATHHLNILLVIACAAVGATLGGSAGYWIGRQFGYRLLIGYGRYVWMTPARIKLGQYLFLRFGAKIVLFGRFLPVVRVIIAFLAGANEMNWPRFFAFNAAGSTLWACVVGTAAFTLGHAGIHLLQSLGYLLSVLAAVLVVAGFLLLRHNEQRLIADAERALPGPVTSKPWRQWRRGSRRRSG